jgi:hypothetical protein
MAKPINPKPPKMTKAALKAEKPIKVDMTADELLKLALNTPIKKKKKVQPIDKNKRYNEIAHATIKWRGIILHQMSHLEKAIDNYIIFHLTDKKDEFKVGQMQLLVFGDSRITLENKRQIFHEIAKVHDNKWYLKYTPIRKMQIKGDTIPLNKDLLYCIQSRNVLAHCVADTTDEALTDTEKIGFLKFKNTSEKVTFTEKELGELELTIINLYKYIAERNSV